MIIKENKRYWLEKWKEKQCEIHKCPENVACYKCEYDYDLSMIMKEDTMWRQYL